MKTFSENVFIIGEEFIVHSPKRSKISDVAARAGVSNSTVSRVLNENAPVAETTVQRVMEAVEALDYRPHAAAQVLASRRTKTIGLRLPEISGSYFPPMLRGIERQVRERGYELLIHATSQSATSVGRPRTLGEHNTDGILIFTDSATDHEITQLHKTGLPLVLLNRSSPKGLKIPSVTFENKGGAEKMVNYLIEERGHTRIAFLKGPEGNEDSNWRELGYIKALENHGIPIDSAYIARGEFEGEIAAQAMRNWLLEGLEIDAVFAGDDDSAAGTITALHQAGVRVPEDIAVVGFDDVPLSRYLTPPLTTVRAPIETAGQEAANQLINLIEKEEAEEMVLLPTHLVIRRSCGNNKEEEVRLNQ